MRNILMPIPGTYNNSAARYAHTEEDGIYHVFFHVIVFTRQIGLEKFSPKEFSVTESCLRPQDHAVHFLFSDSTSALTVHVHVHNLAMFYNCCPSFVLRPIFV